ncbi:MAG TPA: class I lanthipeptide [Thermoanaerobaculia bacterium]|jgi:hypothetical protein|nr:class I lanthipeptide [Thermoanaerobaculia bacterium]
MKKRALKKLTLNRETVIHLDPDRLAKAGGGVTCHASGSCPPPSTQACSDSGCPSAPTIC